MTRTPDPYQKAAIEATGKHVVVAAAAGSGKTFVLVERIKTMIARGVDPSKMVVLTFTRYAANEMRERIGKATARRLRFIGTYHAFALNMLIEHGAVNRWEPEWLTLLDEDECEFEERRALEACGILKRNSWKRCKADDWRRFKLSRYSGAEMPALAPSLLEDLAAAAKSVETTLHAENCATFDMLIDEASKLIDNTGAVGAEIRAQCRHLLVDEMQDSDGRHWWFLKSLKPDSFFAVGDISQSLYEFRAARPQMLLDYILNEADQVFPLPRTYRFGAEVAGPANRLISHNSVKLEMQIETLPGRHTHLDVGEGEDNERVIARIESILASGAAPESIVVLARNHFTLEKMDRALREHKRVPHEYLGRADHVTKTSEFRAIKGFLRLMCNPHDRRGFMGAAPSLNLYGDDLWAIRNKASATGASLFTAYGHLVLPDKLDALRPWLDQRDTMANYSEAWEYIEDVQRRFAYDNARDLLNHLQSETVQDRLRPKTNKVTLMTVHGAKGLEWDNVLVVGMNEGVFPSRRAVLSGEIESERRCMYVAMTRARKGLALIHRKTHNADEQGQSQFLFEMSDPKTINPKGE